MPKLLQINSVINTGSTGRIVEQLGRFIENEGWESYVAYGRNSNKSALRTIKIGNKFDQEIHGVKTRLFDQHGLGSKVATKKLVKDIRIIKPDLIHLHNIHGYYINYKILFDFLSKQDIPIVWTLHDCWAFTGHCSYFSDLNCVKWQKGCYECPKKKNYPQSLLIDRSRKNFNEKKKYFSNINNLTIITVSDWLKSKVKKSFLKEKMIKTIYNGIDTDIYQPILIRDDIRERYGIPFDKKILLGVATSWGKRKGLEDYYFLNSKIDDKYIIVLVGLTAKQILQLPKGIIGIERTENVKDLAEFYSAAEIVLNLSYQETFGLTSVEGMSCGTPSIVYNATASPELIDYDTGEIVEPRDIDAVIKAIDKLACKSKEKVMRKCREHVLNSFDQRNKFKEYLTLYESLI